MIFLSGNGKANGIVLSWNERGFKANVTGQFRDISLLFFTGFTQVDNCEDSFNLGDDVDFLSAMNDDKEGNKSDEVDF